MMNLSYLMDHILHQIFKIILKSIYVKKIENLTIKTRYYFELSMHESIKLLESTKSKIIKVENGENVLRLEMAEVVLILFNVFSNDYYFVPNKSFSQLLSISTKHFLL